MRGRVLLLQRWRSEILRACGKDSNKLMAHHHQQQQQRRFLASHTLQTLNPEPPAEESTTTLELWTWGRGEAGQLGLGKESTERSPSLLESLPHKFRLAPMPGILEFPNRNSLTGQPQSSRVGSVRGYSAIDGVEQVGISCGLFHSCFWKNGELWLWGKGDGGRLGSGSEVSLYSPHLNPFLTNVKSVALGGLHSAAITEDGDVYTL